MGPEKTEVENENETCIASDHVYQPRSGYCKTSMLSSESVKEANNVRNLISDISAEKMFDNITSNIVNILSTNQYRNSPIIRNNVKYSVGVLANAISKSQIYQKLLHRNLQAIAFRSVGPKLVRIFRRRQRS